MIYVIIPVFNRWEFTKNCLISLSKQTFRNYKVIVVDHGSTDGTSEFIAEEFPNVTVLLGDEKMWWTAATNFGIKYALSKKAKYILTLNNDTIITKNYFYNLLHAVAVAPKYALIGSTAIEKRTKNIIYCGEKTNWYTETSFYWHKNENNEELPELLPVNVFPGRGLLIHHKVFENVGLFDEYNFPHYAADYDFTLRAQEKGFEVFCALNARVITFPDESGANKLLNKRSIKNYINYLTSIKGTGNIKLFYKYSFRHCPISALPFYIFLGTARRVFGYWIR